MTVSRIKPVYVDTIPTTLEDGLIYISKKYQTAVHRCCCGCGYRVVTPLKPGGWTLTDQKGAVSLYPSIGNWSYPCKSHYWIQTGGVEWSVQLSPLQIGLNRDRDRADADRAADNLNQEHKRKSQSLWRRAIRWVFRR